MAFTPAPVLSAATLLVVALGGCAGTSDPAADFPPAPPAGAAASAGVATPSAAASPSATPSGAARVPSAAASAPPSPSALHGDRPRRASAASMSIPALGLRGLPVVAYTGHADDLPGTRIQNRGVVASPRGPRGGVGPGEIGNFIVTGHRTSHGAPFRRLPSLRNGEHILVASGGSVYDYVVTDTMTISFRSARDLARQSAPVPGHPGRRATQPMITLSTCATPEDHAQGNYWADELGNPEHRIDKVGVLVAIRDV